MQQQLLRRSSRCLPSAYGRASISSNRLHGHPVRHHRTPAATASASPSSQPQAHHEAPEAVAPEAAVASAPVDAEGNAIAPEAVLDVEKVVEPEYVEIEVTTEVEVEDPGFQPMVALQQAQTFLTTTTAGRGVSLAAAGLVLAALALAAYKAYQKDNTAKAKRTKQIDRNKQLVTELSKFLPDNRSKLSEGVLRGLKSSTGFNSTEVFRKYLWYLLRERKFDQSAVDDMVALKTAAKLSDDEVADALSDRAQRVYEKYGTLMLNTEGFTASGLQRKAACKGLFQKIMFLIECGLLVPSDSEAAKKTNLRAIFGATEEDMQKLRIVLLTDEGVEQMLSQGEKVTDDEAEAPPASSDEPQQQAPQQPGPPQP